MQPSIEELLRAASDFAQQGKFYEAERLYRLILSRDGNHAESLHGLGLIAMETGHLPQAEALMRRSIQLRPRKLEFHVSLSEALRRAGKNEAAIEELQRAIEIDPTVPGCYSNIAVILANEGRHEESLPWARKALEVNPNMVFAMLSLGQSLIELRRIDEAAEVLQRCQKVDPTNHAAPFYLAAATGQTIPSPPADFAARLFDNYAETFDEHIARLNYRVPELLREAVDRVRPTGTFDILDLGCGTGLVGVRFADRARAIVGVDVSLQMLRRAQQRGIYANLLHADLLHALDGVKEQADLIIAGDVFVYVGELSSVFARAFDALRPGGLFAFSVELHDGEGFVLRASRRYAHSQSYIAKLAADCGFETLMHEHAVLRRETEKVMDGLIYVLCKPPSSSS